MQVTCPWFKTQWRQAILWEFLVPMTTWEEVEMMSCTVSLMCASFFITIKSS